jgi:hypothetical protein
MNEIFENMEKAYNDFVKAADEFIAGRKEKEQK